MTTKSKIFYYDPKLYCMRMVEVEYDQMKVTQKMIAFYRDEKELISIPVTKQTVRIETVS